MTDFDNTDLQSVLAYIKGEYGLDCFYDGKIISYLSELAPNLKREKSLMRKLTNNGFVKEIAENANSDENRQLETISKSYDYLVENEFIQPETAETHINILGSFFGYKVRLEKQQDEQNIFVPESISVSFPEIVTSKPVESSEKIKCVWCGSDNSVNSKFCNMCGKEIGAHKDSHEYSVKDFQKVLDGLKNEFGIEMVFCSAGSFMMGSLLKDLERRNDEILHKVIFSRPFCIGRYLVTQKQFQDITGKNPSYFKGASNPVERVNWVEAKAFCEKLNKIFVSDLPKDYKFDLPSEAQWEYACRAGSALNDGKTFTTVNGISCKLNEVAWFRDNSGETTHPGGKKKPNAWGIYDMHGNVSEWCRDFYEAYPTDCVTDPLGTDYGDFHVLRGGGWNSDSSGCRSSFRFSGGSNLRSNDLGFRLAIVSNS